MSKLYYNEAVQIDPIECGSAILTKIRIEAESYFTGEIALTDCNRIVTWYFNEKDDSLEKLDKAIKALQRFKKELIKARKDFKKNQEPTR